MFATIDADVLYTHRNYMNVLNKNKKVNLKATFRIAVKSIVIIIKVIMLLHYHRIQF